MALLNKHVLMGLDALTAGSLSGELKVEGGATLDGALATILANAVAESTARVAAEAGIAADLSAYEASNDAALAAEVARATAAEALQEGRIDAILNGSSADLDQFVEVVAAYTAADGNLQTSIGNLSTVASDDRAAIRSEIAAAKLVDDAAMVAEITRASAAEAGIQADVDANEVASLASFAAASAALSAEEAARIADVDAEETRALAAEASISGQMDLGNGFSVSSAGGYQMGWGAGKPKMEFAIVDGNVVMSVSVG